MSYTVENRGVRDALPSENWVDKVYISSEPQFDEDKAVLVGMKERKGYLNVNDIYTETMKIGIPANVTTSQYVYVVADANNDVFEYIGENNNVYQSPIISIELYDCDLKAVSLTCANTLQWGQNVSMDYKISNAGTSETTAHTYYHAVYLSQDEKLDGEDMELAIVTAKTLAGGDSE